MKKKIMPVLVVIVLILLIIGGVLAVSLIKKYTPSKERKELSEYYNLTSADQVALIYNYEVLDTTALLLDGSVYGDRQYDRQVPASAPAPRGGRPREVYFLQEVQQGLPDGT